MSILGSMSTGASKHIDSAILGGSDPVLVWAAAPCGR